MSDDKKLELYTVTIETEIVVLAESLEQAIGAAQKAHRDFDSSAFSYHANRMRYMPGDWSDSIPYGERDEKEPDRTVEQWIALGAAPDYSLHRVRKS